jgi:hypothetical protein
MVSLSTGAAPARTMSTDTVRRSAHPTTGALHERALGVVLGWYGALILAYATVAHALPESSADPMCTPLGCSRSVRHLMLTVGAGVGTALLLCALLISAVVVAVRADRARSGVVLGTSAACTGLAGALLFLVSAVLLYAG